MLRLSHSTVGGLIDPDTGCAYRVGLKSIVKLPSPPSERNAVGVVFHSLLEAHERARALWAMSGGQMGDPTGVPFDDLVELAPGLLNTSGVEWTADGFLEACKQVEILLWNWWHASIPEGQLGTGGSLRDRSMNWRPVVLEGRWNLWMPPYTSLEVVGFIDAVYHDEAADEYVVVDWKSARKFTKWKLDGEGARDQATQYVLAAVRAPSIPVRIGRLPRFEYHVARTETGSRSDFQGARVVPIDVTAQDIAFVESRIARAHTQQLSGQWPKNPHSVFCSEEWCPYFLKQCDPFAANEFDIESYR